MYQIPWIGRLEFDDRQGRRWCLKHGLNDPDLTLIGPDGELPTVKNKNDLPVLELLVHKSVGEAVVARTGLLNIQIYDIIWGKAERGLASGTKPDNDRNASDNVVPIITRLRRLLGGNDNIKSINYGYKFLGTNVELHTDGAQKPASGKLRAVVPVSGLVVGLEVEIETGLRQWLTDRQRPLLIWGPPGIGKSTLALALLNHRQVVERFGARRYWLRCDGHNSAVAVKQAIGQNWFGLAPAALADRPSSSHQLPSIDAQILQCLGEGPVACVIDNFETPHEGDPAGSEAWLKVLLSVDDVWLIVTRHGKQLPAGLHWSPPIEPTLLSGENARSLFCQITGEPGHKGDPRLDQLLSDLNGLPRAIELLAHQAVEADLGILVRRWREHGTLMLERMGGEARDTSLPRTYQFVIDSVSEGARRLLRLLACLPIGAVEAELPNILSRLGAASPFDAAQELVRITLTFRERGRVRLLSPMRDYVSRQHAATATDRAEVYRYFLDIALRLRGTASTYHKRLDLRNHNRAAAARLSEEYPNVCWAVESALEVRDETALPGALILGQFARVFGHDCTELLEKAERMAIAVGDLVAAAGANLAVAYLEQTRDTGRAGSHVLKAAKRYSDLDDAEGMAHCLFIIGLQSVISQDHIEAEDSFITAARLFAYTGDQIGVAACLRELGSIATHAGYYEAAELSLQAAVRISGDHRDELGRAHNLRKLAMLCCVRGQHSAANIRLCEAEQVFQTMPAKGAEADCQLLRGIVAVHGGDPQAGGFLESALAHYLAHGNNWSGSICLLLLGNLAFEAETDDRAVDCYRRAREMAHTAGNNQVSIASIIGLVRLALLHDSFEEAAALGEQTGALFHGNRSRQANIEDARDFMQRGLSSFAKDDFIESEMYNREALAIFLATRVVAYVPSLVFAIAECLFGQRKWEAAEIWFEMALQMFRGRRRRRRWFHLQVPCNQRLGFIARVKGDRDKATLHYNAALRICTKLSDEATASKIRRTLEEVG